MNSFKKEDDMQQKWKKILTLFCNLNFMISSTLGKQIALAAGSDVIFIPQWKKFYVELWKIMRYTE